MKKEDWDVNNNKQPLHTQHSFTFLFPEAISKSQDSLGHILYLCDLNKLLTHARSQSPYL